VSNERFGKEAPARLHGALRDTDGKLLWKERQDERSNGRSGIDPGESAHMASAVADFPQKRS